MKETNQKNGLDIDLISIVKYFQQCKNEVCISRNGYLSFMFSLKSKKGSDIALTSIVKYFQQCKNEVCIHRNGYPSFTFSLKTPLYTYSFIYKKPS